MGLIAAGATLCFSPVAGWLARRTTVALTPESDAWPSLAAAAALAALLAASLVLTGSAPPHMGAGAALGWLLLALTLSDLTAMRLPDRLTLPLILFGLAVAAGGSGRFDSQSLVAHAIGAAAGYLALAGLGFAYRRLRGVDGLGLGDAKLLAGAGAWLGWRPLPLIVLLACAAAFAWLAVRLLLQGRRSLSTPLAFGAPLALAIWIAWLLQFDLWLAP